MHLSKDEQILYNHFEDMYDIAYNRGAPIYSDFMGLNNVELAYMLLENKGIPKNLYDKKICIYGGYDGAIYQMLCFLPESYYIDIKQSDFPISCVKISPVNKKFCDKLTHRDFLGAVMNLGIKRDQVGDIVVKEVDSYSKAYEAYIFCKSNKEKLISSITQIKHTTVKTEIISNAEISIEQKFKEISGSAMKNIPAIIPDRNTLDQFNSFCAPIFAQQKILEEQNHSLAMLRDSLLPKLMSGAIDIASIQL